MPDIEQKLPALLIWSAAAYLLVINLWAFCLYGIDKRRAGKGKRRISEKCLLWLAFLGGGVGAWCGMSRFRHKTKHWKFRILVPLAVILWGVGIGYLTYHYLKYIQLW